MKGGDMPTFEIFLKKKKFTFEMVFMRKLWGVWLEKTQC